METFSQKNWKYFLYLLWCDQWALRMSHRVTKGLAAFSPWFHRNSFTASSASHSLSKKWCQRERFLHEQPGASGIHTHLHDFSQSFLVQTLVPSSQTVSWSYYWDRHELSLTNFMKILRHLKVLQNWLTSSLPTCIFPCSTTVYATDEEMTRITRIDADVKWGWHSQRGWFVTVPGSLVLSWVFPELNRLWYTEVSYRDCSDDGDILHWGICYPHRLI